MAIKNAEEAREHWYAYILLCGDGSFYCGYTVDLKKRIKTHNDGKGAKYTRSRRPVRLGYYEELDTKTDALKREAGLKRLSHKQKEELCALVGICDIAL